ncbi:MAG: hydrogenase [Clostridiales bacterium GWC2_40_7]|nr:MAG: hydrogenase [Clostridiales bacterium GWC2_40_7]
MEEIAKILNIISICILISTFSLVASKRILSYLNAFRIQSILLAAVAAIYSVYYLVEEGKLEGIIIIFFLTVALKVIYIPKMLKKISLRVEYKVEKDFFINIPISIIICCGLVVLTWFTVSKIPLMNNGYNGIFLVQSVSVILMGLFFMISRKKAIGQIIGLLVIENGTFLTAMLLTSGMPMIVEFGIFFDLLTAVLILGIFVFRINENFEHIDINKLRNLRG